MKKLCIALAVLVVLVLSATVGGLALLLRGGISAKVEPTSVVTAVAGKLRRLGIPRPFREFGNPVASSTTAQDLKASDRVVVHAKKKAGRLEAVKVQFKSAERPKKR